jgi:hypothetical protein
MAVVTSPPANRYPSRPEPGLTPEEIITRATFLASLVDRDLAKLIFNVAG